MNKNECDTILSSLLGSEGLVIKWWNSKNNAFNMLTPNEQWDVNKESVIDYVLGQLNGDFL